MLVEKLDGRALEIAREIDASLNTFNATKDAIKEKAIAELRKLDQDHGEKINSLTKELVAAADLPAALGEPSNGKYGPPRLDLRYLTDLGLAFVTADEDDEHSVEFDVAHDAVVGQ